MKYPTVRRPTTGRRYLRANRHHNASLVLDPTYEAGYVPTVGDDLREAADRLMELAYYVKAKRAERPGFVLPDGTAFARSEVVPNGGYYPGGGYYGKVEARRQAAERRQAEQYEAWRRDQWNREIALLRENGMVLTGAALTTKVAERRHAVGLPPLSARGPLSERAFINAIDDLVTKHSFPYAEAP